MGKKKLLMSYKIDTIIFDLGGVLVDWNPAYLFKGIFNGDETKMNWFLNNVCTSDWNVAQDAGRTIEEAEKIKIAQFPEYEPLIKLYYKEWEHMFSGTIKKNVAIFKALKASKNYNVYALTNWSAETWPKALQLFPFFKEFDGVVVSGQEHTRKPFDKIYNILFERYDINPEAAIFIDDNFENIQAAKKLGLNTIHIHAQADLKKTLKKLKIKF